MAANNLCKLNGHGILWYGPDFFFAPENKGRERDSGKIHVHEKAEILT